MCVCVCGFTEHVSHGCCVARRAHAHMRYMCASMLPCPQLSFRNSYCTVALRSAQPRIVAPRWVRSRQSHFPLCPTLRHSPFTSSRCGHIRHTTTTHSVASIPLVLGRIPPANMRQRRLASASPLRQLAPQGNRIGSWLGARRWGRGSPHLVSNSPRIECALPGDSPISHVRVLRGGALALFGDTHAQTSAHVCVALGDDRTNCTLTIVMRHRQSLSTASTPSRNLHSSLAGPSRLGLACAWPT